MRFILEQPSEHRKAILILDLEKSKKALVKFNLVVSYKVEKSCST